MENFESKVLGPKEKLDGLVSIKETYIFTGGKNVENIVLEKDILVGDKKISDRLLVGCTIEDGLKVSNENLAEEGDLRSKTFIGGGQVIGVEATDFFGEILSYPQHQGKIFSKKGDTLKVKGEIYLGQSDLIMSKLKEQVSCLLER